MLSYSSGNIKYLRNIFSRYFVIGLIMTLKGVNLKMKKLKNIICCALCLAMAAALCACSAQDNKSTDNNKQIANPVHESSAEEFKAAGIVMPEIEGKTPVYTTIDADTLKDLYFKTVDVNASGAPAVVG